MDHSHAEYATHEEINGFGSRLNSTEKDLSRTTSVAERSKEDIEKLFVLTQKCAETAQQFETSTITNIAQLRSSFDASVAGIERKVNELRWWIAGAVAAVGVTLKVLDFFGMMK